jgi:cytochrome oxidase assembly protein ShyY1
VPAASRVARIVALVAFGLVLAVVCSAAGTWQWHRFEEKRAANGELRAAAEQPAVPLDEVLPPGRPVDERLRFRTVTASGRYDVAGQVLVRQREVGGATGFLVVAPLRTTSGATLFVSRGFVAATGAATDTPAVPDPPAGEVRLTGRLYPTETGGLGTGLPDRQVSHVDVPALAARTGGSPAYGGFVELMSAEPADTGLVPLPAPDLGNPAGGAFTGQHLAYVVQWFLFAAFALAGPVILLLLDRRTRRQAGRSPGDTEREPAPTG